MLRGIYTAASGMLVESLKTDVIANNLANAQTHGFKRQLATVRAYPERGLHRINDPVGGVIGDPKPLIGSLGTGAAIDGLGLDLTPGAFTFTGRALDVALDGPGFFAVQTPTGGIAYTRAGALRVDGEGYLVDAGANRLMGENGPVFVGARMPRIDEEGRVWVGGEPVAQLAVVEFAEPVALERLGGNLLAATLASGAPTPAEGTRVRPEYLEEANVVVVREMVDMIASQRAYEANQRMIQVQDETLGRLINDAGTLR